MAKVDLTVVPQVTSLTPSNGDQDVPTATPEVIAEFDHDMDTSGICVQTPCGSDGICYKNYRWDGPRRLVISADTRLVPNHLYELSLGIKDRCYMRGLNGIAMDLTSWVFITGSN